jgi:hypothetical protein
MSERVAQAIAERERRTRGEPEPRSSRGRKSQQLQGEESAPVPEGEEAAQAVEEVSGAEGE